MADDADTFTQTCVCGRVFSDLGAFTHHEKGCRKGKKQLSNALSKAKEVYQAKKAKLTPASSCSSLGPNVSAEPSSSTTNDASTMPEEQHASTLHQVGVWNITDQFWVIFSIATSVARGWRPTFSAEEVSTD